MAVSILLVDDFEPWRRSVSSLLRSKPEFQIVGEASDGLEAIQKAEELQPDLILLDIGLPKLNGIEAAARIAQVAPQSRIVFCSQLNDPEVMRAALSDGARGYILKLDAASELSPALESILRGEKYVSRRVGGFTNT
jgi:DNA-binding NarL/FixJ family response regulator